MRSTVLIIVAILIVGCVIYLFSAPSKPEHWMINVVKNHLATINPDYKSIPIREGESSYTENKSIIYLCLKDPKTGELYSLNTLIYVTLHEIAHMISKNYGHGDEWKRNFKRLTDEAIRKRLYDPSRPVPDDYCGMKD